MVAYTIEDEERNDKRDSALKESMMSNDMPEIRAIIDKIQWACHDIIEEDHVKELESHVQQLIQDAVSEAKREATKGYVTKVAYDALKNNLEQLIKEKQALKQRLIDAVNGQKKAYSLWLSDYEDGIISGANEVADNMLELIEKVFRNEEN